MAWYEQSFGKDYLIVYKHRDFQGANDEVNQMIRWIHLQAGAAILDLCCGMGRHSLALADLGYAVTGLDLSEVLLAEAKIIDSSHRVKWVQGDMRNIPLQGGFDAVLNLFTSFGYFDTDKENAKVLNEIDRMLVPDGRFIIDYLNPAYVENNLVPYSERWDDSLKIEETRSIENNFVKKRIVVIEHNFPERHYVEQVKLYGLDQFKAMLEDTDLLIDQVYGYYNEQAYNEQHSPRLIIAGHKKG